MNDIIKSLSIVLLAGTAVSCDDYIDCGSEYTDVIRFGVTVSGNGRGDAWQSPTRSAAVQGIKVAELRNESNGKKMYLHTEISDFPEGKTVSSSGMRSRGAVVSSDGDGFRNMYSEIAVSGYYYEDDWSASDYVGGPSYFLNSIARGSDKSYNLTETKYWPGQGNMRFLAYAPYGDSNYAFYVNHSAREVPFIHVAVPENADDQKDLLVSYTREIGCKGTREPVKINFKHPLTCVRFAFSDDMVRCRIVKVTMENIVSEGDIILDDFKDSGKESSADNNLTSANVALWSYTKTFTLEPSDYIVKEPGELITPEDNSFVMMPQWVSGQAVSIVIQQVDENGNEVGGQETITGALPGTSWEPGKIVTYKVSYLDQTLSVEQPYVFDYMGMVYDGKNRVDGGFLDYNPIKVTSYVGSTSELVDWKMEYSEDNGATYSDACSWLSPVISDIAGSPATKLLKFTVPQSAIQQSMRSVDIDNMLRSQPETGSKTAPVNLSASPRAANSVIQETANCYIVNGPGWYSFPLVYGCGVQSGAEQTKSYTYSGGSQSGVDVLPVFRNYKNANITSAYIRKDLGASVPASAELVWQDEKGLVTSSSIEYVPDMYGGNGGIRFNVPSGSTLKQGNALIALKDASGTVIWSWHIWVTRFDFDETIDITGHDNNTYSMMTMNLGWCSGHGEIIRFFPKRSCMVRITAGNMIKEINVVQESHVAFTRGNNTYYQWGRKDPFVGQLEEGVSGDDGTKPWYDSAGTEHTSKPALISSSLFVTVGNLHRLIQNPGKWQTPPYTGTVNVDATSANKTYSNLWKGDAKTASVPYKTVYDPCPPGYQVGDYQPFTAFTESGEGETGDQVNEVKYTYPGNPTDYLMEFYTNTEKYQSSVFPLTGYRDWVAEGAAYIFNQGGHMWSNSYCYWNSLDNVYYLRFLLNGTKDGKQVGYVVDPANAYYSCDGFAIRPWAQR